jgi:hypothetical protein
MRTYETPLHKEADEARAASILQPSAEDWKAASRRMLPSQSQSKIEPDQLDLSAPIYPAAHHPSHVHGHHSTGNGAHRAGHGHDHHAGHFAQHIDSHRLQGQDRETLKAKPIAQMGEQGELLFHEYLPRYYPIDPQSPPHFYPSEVAPRKLIPGR